MGYIGNQETPRRAPTTQDGVVKKKNSNKILEGETF
jgi:hypothetical protein